MARIPRSTTACLPFVLTLLVGACGAAGPSGPPTHLDLAADLRPQRPIAAPGECWGDDTIPALIETVTEQATMSAASGAGRAYRTEVRQRILRDRARVWFRTPCPADLTPEGIATLQRALKARGHYTGPLTSVLDAPTAEAIRRYQNTRGLNSPILSLEGARRLGVLPVELDLPQ